MNTGQTLLVIAAFAMLSLITLAVNGTLISTSSTGIQMETSLNALSIAQTMLDEILAKDFDQHTAGGHRVFDYASMTDPALLGPEGSEKNWSIDSTKTGGYYSQWRYNDVDDYNGYVRAAITPRLGWFRVSVKVFYVDEFTPTVQSNTRTWQKKIVVTVTHTSMPRDVQGNPIPYDLEDISVYRKYY
jgi:hypothetical protein